MAKRNSGNTKAASRYVAYYRVSTDRQGKSGLGLEAQRQAVREYLAGNGWPPIDEFTEVESGKRNDRPELAKALEACQLYGATLIVAKLDRLARNVAFISNLMESGVDFRAVDFPEANRLTVHVLAAVAEHERKMIVERTKDALANSTKKLGGWRGGPKPTDAQRLAASAAVRAAADVKAERLRRKVTEIMAEGITSAAGLARRLNEIGVPTPRARDGGWKAIQARRLLDRLGLVNGAAQPETAKAA